MRMPVEAIRNRMLNAMRAAGFTDLVPAHSAVLRYPGPHGRRPSDVAAEAGMSKQAMNYLLRELEDLGYLVRRVDPEDKRSRRIELTDRGMAARDKLRTTVSAIENDMARELGPEEFAQLKTLLMALNNTTLLREFREATGQQSTLPGTSRS
jgi:DNA-binding MarR family transcriptional regulator